MAVLAAAIKRSPLLAADVGYAMMSWATCTDMTLDLARSMGPAFTATPEALHPDALHLLIFAAVVGACQQAGGTTTAVDVVSDAFAQLERSHTMPMDALMRAVQLGEVPRATAVLLLVVLALQRALREHGAAVDQRGPRSEATLQARDGVFACVLGCLRLLQRYQALLSCSCLVASTPRHLRARAAAVYDELLGQLEPATLFTLGPTDADADAAAAMAKVKAGAAKTCQHHASRTASTALSRDDMIDLQLLATRRRRGGPPCSPSTPACLLRRWSCSCGRLR
mmetsp:Transcript_5073/g.18245  ORF Transcript_5073/g.18245 Transcript_5073/m.18245 type:complete len:282 (-) Transcript_5073:210-1055(-)